MKPSFKPDHAYKDGVAFLDPRIIVGFVYFSIYKGKLELLFFLESLLKLLEELCNLGIRTC